MFVVSLLNQKTKFVVSLSHTSQVLSKPNCKQLILFLEDHKTFISSFSIHIERFFKILIFIHFKILVNRSYTLLILSQSNLLHSFFNL